MSVAYGPYWDLRGLSTDEKPLDVPNGSSFFEKDTKKVFLFDADSKTWLEQSYPEGGSGGGTGNVSSTEITTIKVLDRAEYDALPAKDAKTVYLIRG